MIEQRILIGLIIGFICGLLLAYIRNEDYELYGAIGFYTGGVVTMLSCFIFP